MAEQIERTIDGMIEKLNNELPAKIDEFNAGVTDGYLLQHPTAITFGQRVEMQFPHVAVSPDTTNGSDASGRIFWNHLLAVTSWIVDTDPEGLVRKLIRYQGAIRQVMMRGRYPGPAEFDSAGYGLQHVEDEYGEPFMREEVAGGLMVAYATTIYAVQQQQDLP